MIDRARPPRRRSTPRQFAALGILALVCTAACETETAQPDAPATGPEASSPAATSALPAVPPLSESLMRSLTEELSSDAYGGRAPGTEGEQKTIATLTKAFAEAGLEPGNGDSWLQSVPLVSIESTRITPLTIGGGTQSLSFAPTTDIVAVTYREQEAVRVDDSEVVFVGYGIRAPERDWDDYAGVDVTGKTVIVLVNDPDFGTESLTGPFGGRAMTYYGRWTYKYEEAARQGAAAAFIVHDTAPAAYGWNVVASSWTGPQFHAATADGGASQTLVNGWLQLEAARSILASAGEDLDALTAAAREPSFRARALGVTASIALDNTLARTTSNNIVGRLPGTTRPEEHVLYTAHWDHLGRCSPAPDGDDICNGAVDNATGTAALAALAQAHAAAGPAPRSLLFLAVTAEESGLLGSRHYAENPLYPLSTTVGGVNMDAFPMTGPARDVVVVGYGKSELDANLEAALEAAGRVARPEPTPEKGFYYRSDHFSFAKLGVPMIYFDGGEDLLEGGVEAGRASAQDYADNRYHGPKDEFDPDWDWRGVMQDLEIYYSVGRQLAESDAWPNWREGDEFRARRDADRAGLPGSGASTLATAAAQQWLALMDAQRYDDSYESAAGNLREQMGPNDWRRLNRSVRAPLGAVSARRLAKVTGTTTVPNTPPGSYVVVEFETEFDGGEAATDQSARREVLVMTEENNAWRVRAYFVR